MIGTLIFFMGFLCGLSFVTKDKTYIKKKNPIEILNENIDSLCMSMDHSFGLMTEEEKKESRFWAKAWIHAASKELK